MTLIFVFLLKATLLVFGQDVNKFIIRDLLRINLII